MIKDNTNQNVSYLSEPVVEDGVLNEQGVLNIALSFFGLNRCLYVETPDTTPVANKKYYKYENNTYSEVQVESDDNPHDLGYFEESQEKEVILFRQYLDVAKLYCCRLMDWSFQIDTKTYEEDDINNAEEISKDEIDEQESGTLVEYDNGVYTAYKTFKNFQYQFKLPENLLKIKYINGIYNKGYAIKGKYFYCNSKAPVLDFMTSEMTNIPLDFGYMVAYRVAIELSQFLNVDAGQKASSMFSIVFQTLKDNEDASFRIENPPQDYFINPDSEYWKKNGVVPR